MNPLPSTRHSLLIRLRAEHEGAWNEFLEIYEKAIYRWARRRGLQDADAQDTVQEVFHRLQQMLPQWRADKSSGSLRGWLQRVTRNVAVDVIRRQQREPVGSGQTSMMNRLHSIPTDESEADETLGYEIRRLLFTRAAEQVRSQVQDATWQAFWLTTIEQLPGDVVAKTLGLSIGSIYTAKCRVLARIRKQLEDWSCDEPIGTTLPWPSSSLFKPSSDASDS